MFFYSISLVVLVVFFLDELIYWYEALVLFLWYGAYVGFMKFNEPVEDSLRALLRLPKIVSKRAIWSQFGTKKGSGAIWSQFRAKGVWGLTWSPKEELL